jgi:Flp pilus assembly protein TadD
MQADPSQDTAVRLLNKGINLFNTNKFEQAAQSFERVLQIAPDISKTHYMLGLAYANSGQMAKAKEHLTRFLELAPNDENAANAKEMLEYVSKQ